MSTNFLSDLPLIDPAHLLVLTAGDPALQALVMDDFLDSARIILAELKADDGASYRAFVCHTLNAWGYPAKDRSGRLDPIEEPHLGRLMEKIAGPARPAAERLDFAHPAPAAAPVPNTESTSTQES